MTQFMKKLNFNQYNCRLYIVEKVLNISLISEFKIKVLKLFDMLVDDLICFRKKESVIDIDATYDVVLHKET